MRMLALIVFLSFLAPCAVAAPGDQPASTPSLATCKVDLKAWTSERVEPLSIHEIVSRMNTMFACANEASHHRHSDKKVFAYLDAFYNDNGELLARTMDFITRHGLAKQFSLEENGTGH